LIKLTITSNNKNDIVSLIVTIKLKIFLLYKIHVTNNGRRYIKYLNNDNKKKILNLLKELRLFLIFISFEV
jgi:hypothetical protein